MQGSQIVLEHLSGSLASGTLDNPGSTDALDFNLRRTGPITTDRSGSLYILSELPPLLWSAGLLDRLVAVAGTGLLEWMDVGAGDVV